MAGRSKSRDDLNAIDEGWVDLARELAEELGDEPVLSNDASSPPGPLEPSPPPAPAVAREGASTPSPSPPSRTPVPRPPAPAGGDDADIDDIVAHLGPPDEVPGAAAAASFTPTPPRPSTPPPGEARSPSRSLMPPYMPARRPPSRPSGPPVRPPSRPSAPPARPPSAPPPPARPLTGPPGGPARTLLAFGAPDSDSASGSASRPTPQAIGAAPPPTPERQQARTPLVTVIDPDSGEVEAPALTLDLDEMDNPVRKPSAPRVPIDLSDFELSPPPRVRTPIAMTSGPIVAPPPEPGVVPRAPPATPEPRRSSPTPEIVVTTELAPEDTVGFEQELDLPVEPGVAREFNLETEDDLDALGAVERAAEPESVAGRMERDMRERFDAGDFTAALEAADWLLRDQPDHEQAKRYAASCREVLLQMYAVRLGSLDRVPSIVVGTEDLRNLGLDHRAGFVLSCIDGSTSLADILDLSGMPPLESYRILCDLLLANVITVR